MTGMEGRVSIAVVCVFPIKADYREHAEPNATHAHMPAQGHAQRGEIMSVSMYQDKKKKVINTRGYAIHTLVPTHTQAPLCKSF